MYIIDTYLSFFLEAGEIHTLMDRGFMKSVGRSYINSDTCVFVAVWIVDTLVTRERFL